MTSTTYMSCRFPVQDHSRQHCRRAGPFSLVDEVTESNSVLARPTTAPAVAAEGRQYVRP